MIDVEKWSDREAEAEREREKERKRKREKREKEKEKQKETAKSRDNGERAHGRAAGSRSTSHCCAASAPPPARSSSDTANHEITHGPPAGPRFFAARPRATLSPSRTGLAAMMRLCCAGNRKRKRKRRKRTRARGKNRETSGSVFRLTAARIAQNTAHPPLQPPHPGQDIRCKYRLPSTES